MSIEHVTPAGANIFEELGLEDSEKPQTAGTTHA